MTCECGGMGRVVDSIPEGPWVDKGGYQIRNAGGYSSRLCSCRKNLERRQGEATWWTTETTWTETVDLPTMPGEVEIAVSTEVPISEDNYPLIRDAANVYWPSLVEVAGHSLIAEDVRRLAYSLLSAAQIAEDTDREAMARSVTPDPVGSGRRRV